jgi:peptide-methionine (S)-S-oxide reductase
MYAFVVHTSAALVRVAAPAARAAIVARAAISGRARPSRAPSASLRQRSAFLAAALAAPRGARELADGPAMRVASDGETVEVHYVGTLEDGTEFDSSRARGLPLSFVLGAGSVVPGFDDAVRGMAVDERKRAVLPPETAYGERVDALVMSIPRDRAPEEMALEVGQKVPLTNGATATVLGVTDDKIELDANHQLAGKTLIFDLHLVGILDDGTVLPPPAPGVERLIVGLGCFWGAELAFQRVKGVVSTRVGYTQGSKQSPKYREVCSGQTGHTEAVAIDYDPAVVSYETLLDLFWARLGGNALTLNQVGNDRGTQYRSGVYYLNDGQRAAAEAAAKRVSEELGQEVVVELKAAEGRPFFLAEDYHQRYLEKGGQSAAVGDSTPIRCYG